MSILQHLLQIRESANVSTIEVDWADDNGDTKTESGLKADLDHAKKEYGMKDCTFTIKTMNGPGGGWPVVRISGPENQLKKFLDVAYGDDDLDLYKVNESIVLEMRDVSELVDKFFDHIGVHSLEGRRGLTAFAKLCRALGYKDNNYYGQLDADASLGDIINFLEDNSGALQAMVEFIQHHGGSEWQDALTEYLADEGVEHGGDDDEDEDDVREGKDDEKIEAYGVKGMKSTKWRKTFKNQAEFEKWLDAQDGDVEVQGQRPLKESVQLDEKVFDEDKYTWYVWDKKQPSQPFERRGGAKQLERGMQFGLRPATSKAGTWRLIMKQKGPSIIFSIPEDVAKAVAKAALELK